MPKLAGLLHLADGPLRFWRWWIGELDAACADLGGRAGSKWRLNSTVCPSADGFEIVTRRRGEPDEVHKLHDGEQSPVESVVALRVPAAEVLDRVVQLPAAARTDYKSAVQLKLQRASPLPLERVYVAIGEPEARGEMLEVPVALVHRAKVDAWTERLKNLGLHTAAVTTHAGVPFAVGTPGPGRRARLLQTYANPALAVLALAGLGVVAWLWQQRLTSEQDWLDTRISLVRRAAAEDVGLRQRWNRDERLARDIASRQSATDPTRILAMLGERLPREMWLQSFSFEGNAVHVTVFVPARADVGALLIEAPGVQSVTENERIPLGAGVGEERVELLLTLKEATRG